MTWLSLLPRFVRSRVEHRPNLVKIVDNIGWLFLDKVLRMGVGLFVGVWIARYLGPEQFGLLSFAQAFIALFTVIAGLGMQSIVVRDLVRDPAHKEETLGTAAVLMFASGLIVYPMTLGVIFWLRPADPLMQALVAILGSTVLFQASQVAAYWFESQVQSKYTVWVQNAVFLFFAAIKVGLILNHAPLLAFAWAMMAEALVVAVLMLIVLGLRGPRLRQIHVTWVRAKSLFKDSWPLLLSGISIMIYMKIDQIMLGEMIGDEAVGIYSAAVRISEVWYFIPMAIVASVFPSILEAKKRSEEQYYRRLQHLFDLMVWLAVAVALPMTFLSAPVVTLLYGEAYASAATVLSIHIWTGLFVAMGVARGRWLIIENLQYLGALYITIGMLINIIGNLFLIRHLGPSGAAYATLISQCTVAIIAPMMFKKTRSVTLMLIQSLNLLRPHTKLLESRDTSSFR